jgi:hypothetical protein
MDCRNEHGSHGLVFFEFYFIRGQAGTLDFALDSGFG